MRCEVFFIKRKINLRYYCLNQSRFPLAHVTQSRSPSSWFFHSPLNLNDVFLLSNDKCMLTRSLCVFMFACVCVCVYCGSGCHWPLSPMFMLKMRTANLKPVDRYGADQVQFRGTTKSPQGDVSAGLGLIYSHWTKWKQKLVCTTWKHFILRNSCTKKMQLLWLIDKRSNDRKRTILI